MTARFLSAGCATGSAFAGTGGELDISTCRLARRNVWKLMHNPSHRVVNET